MSTSGSAIHAAGGPLATTNSLTGGMPSISLGALLRSSPWLDRQQQHHSQQHLQQPEEQLQEQRWQYLYVLPVLLLEFLAIALTRAVLPSILLQQYGDQVYLVLGVADCVRGLLAFVACPIFGKVSDKIGRRVCLFVTVMGTCAPVCALALFPWETTTEQVIGAAPTDNSTTAVVSSSLLSYNTTTDSASGTSDSFWHLFTSQAHDNDPTMQQMPSQHLSQAGAINTFVVLLALSGIFSSTFTLVFAYISDTVRQQDERVAAYGLALATFGLSFTIGPMAGGYLAQSNTHDVFVCALFFTVLDLMYIYFVLPESKQFTTPLYTSGTGTRADTNDNDAKSQFQFLPNTWSPLETLQVITLDPFLRTVGKVAFLYYTGLWAIISTLSLYAVKRFHLTPERLGELMSALGLCTMVAEAVLVRILVPMLGEKQAMKVGLAAFVIQCFILGVAYEGWHLFLCTVFSMFANLVYPCLSSLVSGSVEPEAVGEALGAINGVKALTEGIGPLVFGSLMTLSEHSALPGWPYLLAAVLAYLAYQAADALPDRDDDDYIHELERIKHKRRGASVRDRGIMLQHLINTTTPPKSRNSSAFYPDDTYGREEDGLLSDVEESEEDETRGGMESDVTRLPITFASLVNLPPA
jgi:MFS family permease